MNGLIYVATSKTSGKSYVGQTRQTLIQRKRDHKCSAVKKNRNFPFMSAIRKYGIDDFVFEVVEEGLKTQLELDDAEEFWIQYLLTRTRNGYNIRTGGTTSPLRSSTKDKLKARSKYVPSPETRAKISQSLKGRVPWNKGIPQTEAVKKKVSASLMGNTRRRDWIDKQGPGFKVVSTMSLEDRTKQSEAMKGNKFGQIKSQEVRAAQSARMKGNTLRRDYMARQKAEKEFE